MKKLVTSLLLAAFLMMAPIGVQAYTVTITDPSNDAIGSGFETTKIQYVVNESPFKVDITTQYRLSGILVGSWQTLPADLLLDGAANGVGWDYAIPLVSHDGFTAGHVYSITSLYVSDNFAPSSSYTYNHNEYVWLKTGTDKGLTGTVSNTATWISYVSSGWYWDDSNPAGDYLTLGWATATCANDLIKGSPVPIPTAFWLLSSGLVGLVGIRRRMTL